MTDTPPQDVQGHSPGGRTPAEDPQALGAAALPGSMPMAKSQLGAASASTSAPITMTAEDVARAAMEAHASKTETAGSITQELLAQMMQIVCLSFKCGQ